MLKNILKICFKPLNIVNRILPKDDKLIFLYANLGFYDNVRALYDYAIKEKYNSEYKIVCSVGDYKKYVANAPDNVSFVSTRAGIRHFLRAKYAFYCFGKYPIKPAKSQMVINLWHGVPLKRIGNMESRYKNVDYVFFTKLLATSEFTADILCRCFNCTMDKIIISGQPRTDELFVRSDRDDTIKPGNSRLVVWLPTYREYEINGDKSHLPITGMTRNGADELDKFLHENNCCLIIKLHPLQEGSVYNEFSNIKIIKHNELAAENQSIYDLLRVSDALITDYSSVYFDYLLLDRPIAFVTEDMQQYEDDRGFTVDNPQKYMPGDMINDAEQLRDFISKVINHKDDYREFRHEVNNIVNKYQDGENCKRILEMAGIRKV
ncbi:MAG: CDP-glycerol glycerophosphotransferase family protein [Eubacterium sp.]